MERYKGQNKAESKEAAIRSFFMEKSQGAVGGASMETTVLASVALWVLASVLAMNETTNEQLVGACMQHTAFEQLFIQHALCSIGTHTNSGKPAICDILVPIWGVCVRVVRACNVSKVPGNPVHLTFGFLPLC